MGYPPRLFEEGYWYHVYTRGQRREPLFFAPIDRLAYLSFLDRELDRRDGWIGSYCLMTNHVHLLIQMGKTDLGAIFQSVHSKYAQYFNQKRDTTGHVFQGRPGMKMVLDDSDIIQLVGYIHRNPIEADMVQTVREYEWSSWRWFVDNRNTTLSSWEYPPGFKGDQRDRTFQEAINESFSLEGGENYWGTDEEWNALDRRKEGREGRKYRERRDWVPKEQIAREVIDGSEVSIDDLKSQSQTRTVTAYRREAMGRMYEEGYGPTEIGKWFNRTKGAVNHAYNAWKKE